MANLFQLEQQKGNKLCYDLALDFDLINIYLMMGFTNKSKSEIQIYSYGDTFHRKNGDVVKILFLPFVYKTIPVSFK